jgi:hypothetical protein
MDGLTWLSQILAMPKPITKLSDDFADFTLRNAPARSASTFVPPSLISLARLVGGRQSPNTCGAAPALLKMPYARRMRTNSLENKPSPRISF